MSFRSALSVVALLVLSACATATPYQPAVDGRGFTEQQIENNRFRVTFTGNSLTPRTTVEDYMLYRAAEVTLATGRDYFVVSDRNTDARTAYQSDYPGGLGLGLGFGRGHRFHHAYGFGGIGFGTSTPVTSYQTSIEVVMHDGSKPADDVQAYDARDVIQRLGPTIRRPAEQPT